MRNADIRWRVEELGIHRQRICLNERNSRNKENENCLPHTERLIYLHAKLIKNFIELLGGIIFYRDTSFSFAIVAEFYPGAEMRC